MERHWGAIAALVVGLGLRAIFVAHHPAFAGDTEIYGDLARNMLQHHVYGVTEASSIRSTLIRLPGYPLFLAACFAVFGVERYVPVLWVQVLVGLATCGLVAAVARRLWGGRAGLVALWAGCLCPFTATFDGAALTESWSLFCVALALYGMERWGRERQVRWAAVVGLACAWAVLLRPEQGMLAAACGLTMLWMAVRERRFVSGVGAVLVMSLVVAAPLGVWAVRNWRVFHVVQPLAPKNANDPGEFVSYGFDRWYRTWGVEYTSTTDTYWLYDGSPLRMEDLPARAMDSQAQRAETARVYAAYNDAMSATPEVDAGFARLAEERVKAHPLRSLVAMPVGRELDMWLRPRTEFMKLPLTWWRWREHLVASLVCLLYAGLNVMYLGLAAWGLWRWRGRWASAAGVAGVVFVALRCALLLTIDNSEPRYTLECFPVLWVWIAAFWARRSALAERM